MYVAKKQSNIYCIFLFGLYIKDKFELLRLWYHESCRVFQDRLVCVSDRDWFNSLLKGYIDEFDCSIEDVLPDPPVLFGDFMSPESDQEVYTVIEDKEEVSNTSWFGVYFRYIMDVSTVNEILSDILQIMLRFLA